MTLRFIYICSFLVLFAACSSSPVLTAEPDTSKVTLEPAPTPTSSDIFRLEAWVDNPNPKSGERINISGSLIKNGVYLGGMMMSAYWPDEDDDRLPDCHIQVIYQRGICTVYADNFPVGEYTPVKISFDYFGQTFTGETGFTRAE
jgi:hypothetical protein